MKPSLATRILLALGDLEEIRLTLLAFDALRQDVAEHALRIRAWRKAYRRHWQTAL